MIRKVSLLCALVAVVVSCAAPVHQPLRVATPIATATPSIINLPEDDRPHNDLTEWWYYTGHLTTTAGANYGFEFVIFQIKRDAIPVVYAAHTAVTDHGRQQFHYDQRTWTAESAPTTLNLGDGTWTLRGDGDANLLTTSTSGYRLDLRVIPTKPAALHGHDGVISFGPIGDSYYYSNTRLAVSGSIDDHGVTTTVTGEAWKDRQWGNFLVTPGGGWDWVSAQFDDGSDVMLYLLRDASGNSTGTYGTWVDSQGLTTPISANSAQVKSLGRWQSPHTGTTYPSGWSIYLPAQDVRITLVPVLVDQELDTRQSTGQVYWEGEVVVDVHRSGVSIGGKGYVELTGYFHPPN